MKKLLRSVVLVLVAIMAFGCSRGHANVQTLVTSNCGVDWELIKPGEIVPAMITTCDYKVTIPDYPMQGETRFKTSFKNRVIAGVEVSYEYTIVDGMKFIAEAKYLGKANSDAQDTSNSAAAYESAENTVIDKRLREAATSLLIHQDIIEFNQAEFEDLLLVKANESLATKGIQLSFISFVPTPDEQTRLAIDMLTAVNVYESRNLGELGKAIAVARAGATKITVVSGLNEKSE